MKYCTLLDALDVTQIAKPNRALVLMDELADLFRHQLLSGEWEDAEYVEHRVRSVSTELYQIPLEFYGAPAVKAGFGATVRKVLADFPEVN